MTCKDAPGGVANVKVKQRPMPHMVNVPCHTWSTSHATHGQRPMPHMVKRRPVPHMVLASWSRCGACGTWCMASCSTWFIPSTRARGA
eukprot:364853-Chlamydomonas_euryale.AAC.4